MAHIVFYEKPGCVGNARQKAILAVAGHQVEARSLPDHHWSKEELLTFLDGLPVPDWFNRGARRVKEGDVDPDSISRDQALETLVRDPVLVRRPLLELGGRKLVGFNLEQIEALVGPLPDTRPLRLVRKNDLEECPGHATGIRCEDRAKD